MTTRTRYFVIASLLVMFVGVGTGLVAYYAGIPGLAVPAAALNDLKLIPADSQLVAFVNVRDVMDSELRQRMRKVLPITGEGQREIYERTGINIESDIDRLVVSLAPSVAGKPLPVVVAHGTFDTSRLEGLMREHGATVEEYKGARLIVAPVEQHQDPSGIVPLSTQPTDESFTVSFFEPGAVLIGARVAVRNVIDQKAVGGPGVTGNQELMDLVRSFEGGDMWAVGRFDALTAGNSILPHGLPVELPAITWFAANAEVDQSVRANLRADAKNEEAANNLREVVRGFMALGKLQSESHPELKTLLNSLTVGGTGNTVSLSFEVPGGLVDLLGTIAGKGGVVPAQPLDLK